MAKKEKKAQSIVKLQIPAGQANPSPPVGTQLGKHVPIIKHFGMELNHQTPIMSPGMLYPMVPQNLTLTQCPFAIMLPPQ